MELGISFSGGIADNNKLPAYEGIKSVEHISCSLLIISSFLIEGKIRRKDFRNMPIGFNLLTQRKGSFEFLYEVVLPATPFIAELGMSVAGNLLTDVLKLTYQRLLGHKETVISRDIEFLEEKHSGDLSALVDAIEPSSLQAHNVINNGVMTIQIFNGHSKRDKIIDFNPQTKQYLRESIIDSFPKIKLFSISSYNANQGSGRAYDFDEKRTIPFSVVPEFDAESYNILFYSMHEYTKKKRLNHQLVSASIALKYTCIMTRDGRVKKLILEKARRELNDLVKDQGIII